MKFDIELSPWARWVAQDKDGVWAEYENRPVRYKDFWTDSTGAFGPLCQGTPPADWTQELYQVVWV